MTSTVPASPRPLGVISGPFVSWPENSWARRSNGRLPNAPSRPHKRIRRARLLSPRRVLTKARETGSKKRRRFPRTLLEKGRGQIAKAVLISDAGVNGCSRVCYQPRAALRLPLFIFFTFFCSGSQVLGFSTVDLGARGDTESHFLGHHDGSPVTRQ